jgi:hypothetical protein
MPDISHSRLLELLKYEPEIGLFKRLISLRRDRVGQYTESAPTPSGYAMVHVEGKRYLAHRLAWLYMTGEWPAHPIEHINGILNDNRWTNLRSMRASLPAVTAERVREVFAYNPEVGLLVRRLSSKRNRRGKAVGEHATRYIMVDIDKQRYLAHRLIWFYVYGEWPNGYLDHVNGNPADNRLCNLRLATNSQNQANRGAPKNNTSGFKGVSWHAQAKKWRASIEVRGEKIELGEFHDFEMACNVYAKAASEHFGEFANVN